LLDKTREFLDDFGISGGPLIVAVSGGPDSVALLRSLSVLREKYRFQPLVIAHLNHRLRGPESDMDRAFVFQLYKELAAADQLAFQWRENTVDVRATKAATENLENAARTARYCWFTEVARECGAALVATGHTANDQAETVLHRLLRGTGIKGLGAIPPRRPLASGIDVIRPLLAVAREEVLAFLNELDQDYCHDRTNADRRFTRNRIRQELLPLLERDYNPAIVDVLCRLAYQAHALQWDIELEAAKLLAHAELPRAGDLLIFDAAVLKRASRRQLGEVFRLLWQREGWSQQYMSFAHWQRLARVAREEHPMVELPGGICARCRGRVLQVGRRKLRTK
jgi:tRNA(Ile)-lysidine synthase